MNAYLSFPITCYICIYCNLDNWPHEFRVDGCMLETVLYPMICMYNLHFNHEAFLYISNMNKGSYTHMGPTQAPPPPPTRVYVPVT